MLSFLYVCSDHSILECYNLFSGVELSMRSFFVILVSELSSIKLSLSSATVLSAPIAPSHVESDMLKILSAKFSCFVRRVNLLPQLGKLPTTQLLST